MSGWPYNQEVDPRDGEVWEADDTRREEEERGDGLPPLPPMILERAMKASHRPRATDPVPPSYVKRSAA